MDKIRSTTDPAERQKLLQEHFQSMQEAMQAMRGNMGMTGGMGSCMHMPNCKYQQHCNKTMAGKHCKKGNKCVRGKGMGTMSQGPDDMMPGAGMLEQRMDTMQMMMENMLEHLRQMQPSK